MGAQGCLSIAQHEPGTITLSADHGILLEDVLKQEKFIGDTKEMGEKFLELWHTMWNKHAHLPETHWDQAILAITGKCEGADTTMPWQPITRSSWIQTARSKKATSATGPDAVSRQDILRMPAGLQDQLVHLVNEIEQGQAEWPLSITQGSITAIEKKSCAQEPKDFRPITVLSYTYRNWSSQRARECLKWLAKFCPDHLAGNCPHRATEDIWWQIALEIEDAGYGDGELAGLTTDIQKAFNHLPRSIVKALALHYGLPRQFVATWHQALEQLERFFIIGGEATRAVHGGTGYPEGDPLSVVAMMLLNLGMHEWVRQAVPTSTVYSFVDNWEATSHQVADIPRVFHALQSFAQITDLALDIGKTYGWALNTGGRKLLRNSGLRVSYAT